MPVQSVELNTCISSSESTFCKQFSMFTATEIHSLTIPYVGYDNMDIFHCTLSFTPITTSYSVIRESVDSL